MVTDEPEHPACFQLSNKVIWHTGSEERAFKLQPEGRERLVRLLGGDTTELRLEGCGVYRQCSGG